MFSRAAIRVLSLFLMSSSFVVGLPPSAPRTEAEAAAARPNILIILTDDQRSGLEVMPAVRRHFVKQGVSYRNAFATTPLCCPSRSSILTGKYAHNHGVRTNLHKAALVIDRQSMLQSHLNRAGYRTAMFGKFLHAWPLAESPGFDVWATTKGRTYYGGKWNVNGTLRTGRGYSTSSITDRALRFLRNADRSKQPWFLNLWTIAPHIPYTPQRRYADAPVPAWSGNPALFERDRSDKPLHVRRKPRPSLAEEQALRRNQFRTLRSVDDMVRRVFAELRALGEARNTLAIFLSDNGYMWGEHGLHAKGHPYTQSISVPLLARWSGHLPAGRRSGRLAANIDIAPTILDATNVAPLAARSMDGRSLLAPSRRNRVLTEYWCNVRVCNRWASIRTRRFQYVEYYDPSGAIEFREFYRLRRDPWQLHNVLRDDTRSNDPAVAQLHHRLALDRRCAGRACP